MVSLIAGLVIIAGFVRENWERLSRHPQPQRSGTSLATPSAQGELPMAREKTGENQPWPLSSPVTLQELSAYVYQDYHTSAQIDDFVNRQLNRSVVWEGWVGNVSSDSDGRFTVILRPSTELMLGRGWLTFASAYRPDMLNLSSGQKIKVRGIFTKFDGRFFSLDSCELLQVSPTK
jgi:hypothetical protein